MDIIISDDCKNILKILNKNEFDKGYIVGGSIRDILLKKEPKDIDFATNLDYEELKIRFKDYNPIEIGKSFGIIQITFNDKKYEIAKFRKDIGIKNNRKPKMIEYVNSIEEDLKRRDFTINAMAYNEHEFIDLFNGKQDLENGLIKFIGNPDERIKEDALRILRGIRFATDYDFKIDDLSFQSMKNNNKLIKKLSIERIREEFNKIMISKNVKKGLLILKKLGILEIIIPEIKKTYDYDQHNKHHDRDVFNHIIDVVQATEPIIVIRLSALFHDIAKPRVATKDIDGTYHFYGHEKVAENIVEYRLKKMKYPNELIYNIKKIVGNHMKIFSVDSDKAAKKFIRDVKKKNLDYIFDHFRADLSAKANPNFEILSDLEERVFRILKEENALSIKDLNINGRDLKKIGISEGKQIGEILNKLLEKVYEDDSLNNIFDLSNLAIKMSNQNNKIIHIEKSCGAIIFKVRENREIEFLLVKHKKGNWSFPKGHVENNETEIQTARREVREETNLHVTLFFDFREVISYIPKNYTIKNVVFFIGEAKNQDVEIQENEISDFLWATYEEAKNLIAYKPQKELFNKAYDFLKKPENNRLI